MPIPRTGKDSATPRRRPRPPAALATAAALALGLACTFTGEDSAGWPREGESAGMNQRSIYPGKSWQEASDPRDLGWDPARLDRVLERLEGFGTEAFMIVTGGRVAASRGRIRERLRMHSIRKSLLSALIGIYEAEGLIDLEATLRDLEIGDRSPALTEKEKEARVVDLLRARSGVYHRAVYEVPSMEEKRPGRGTHPPGTFWYYNNWDFNALGTIFRQEVRLSIGEAFAARIAEPLRMQDFRARDVRLVEGPESIHPAYPFRMTARDLARFGLLYLREGRWEDRQIIPRRWVDESTRAHSLTGRLGTKGGYGYMWWVAPAEALLPDVRLPAGTFTASGRGGQRLTILPALETVIVHLMDTDDEREPSVGTGDYNEFLEMLLAARTR